MGLWDGAKEVAGNVWNGVTGQTDYQATPYQVDGSAFIDTNAAYNKQKLSSGQMDRNAMETPEAQAARIASGSIQGAAAQNYWQHQTRGGQASLIQALQDQANGRGGPSPAQMQMKQALGKSMNSQLAMANSARGMSPGMAQRLAAQGMGQAQAETGIASSMLRSQEQAQAQQNLAALLAATRGQDLSSGQQNLQAGMFNAGQQNQATMQNAGFQQQTGLANQNAALEAQRQKDAMAQFYTGSSLGIDAQSFAAKQAAELANAGAHNNAQQTNAGIASSNAANLQNFAGGVFQAGAGIGTAALVSDERAKTNVDRSDRVGKHLGEFLSKLDPVSFDYRDEKHGQGRHYGFMAQDAEKSELGRALVINTPGGKMIDTKKALMAALAANSHLHKRVSKLEGA